MLYTRLPFNGRIKITYTYGDYNPKLNITSDGRHHGLDMVGLDSKNVYATCKGKVIFAGWNNQGYGYLVMIQEENTKRVHYYAHLESISVSNGQTVTYTTKLGIMGSTGNVTGPHTHYEIRDNGVVINPCDYTGLPNKLGTYNSNDYIREEKEESKPARTKLYLPGTVERWRVYRLNVAPVKGNECGFLLPSKFGGLSYDILRWTQSNVAVIKTRDYGEVQIYVGSDTAAVIN